nr:CDPK-related kinase 3 [Tanacetum cinerariifolium]
HGYFEQEGKQSVSVKELSRELNVGLTTHLRLKDRIRSDCKLSLTSLSNNLSQFWKTCSFGYFGIRRD